MFSRYLTPLVIALLLLGCANMNESDCLAADWRIIGFEDGSQGHNESRITQHREECAAFGVTPNLDDYRQGHLEGSERFCTKTNGFFRGQQGKGYERNCPSSLEQQFLLGFRDGQTLYKLKKVLNRHTKSLEASYTKIDQLDHIIAQQNEQMIADGLNRAQRLAIRDNIVEYELEQTRLINALPELQKNFENAAQAYDTAKVRFSGYL